MKKIETVLRHTKNNCSCGGKIAEIFETRIIRRTPVVYGGRNPSSSHIASGGYSCISCGQLYGGTKYPKTEPNQEIVFELSLIEAKLKHKITLDDIPKPKLSVVDKTSKGFPKLMMKEKTISEELLRLKKGSTVYILQRSSLERGIKTNPSCHIQLTKKLGAQIFRVNYSCLE